jgi:hypothetical protein
MKPSFLKSVKLAAPFGQHTEISVRVMPEPLMPELAPYATVTVQTGQAMTQAYGNTEQLRALSLAAAAAADALDAIAAQQVAA